MITFLKGNIFLSNRQTLVNTINCVGVMGKGIALEFRKLFPEMFLDYKLKCCNKKVELGKPYLYKRPAMPWILNFPTKSHWRLDSDLEAIRQGLDHFVQHYKLWEIKDIAFPALGCGCGNLDWNIVRQVMTEFLENISIPVDIYEPK